ncbi:MAG: carboxypeptidase-like regulatory domain-containing protein [Smithella sp.]
MTNYKGRLVSQVILFIFVTMCLAFSGCSNSSSNPIVEATTYTISGQVVEQNNTTIGVPNVPITLSGASAANTTTASDGSYSFSGLGNGSYTVTPSLSGYSFYPSSLAIKLNGGSQAAIFQESTVDLNLTVAGVVSGAVANDVEISLSGTPLASKFTASNGTYSFPFASGDNIVLTPSLTGFRFLPANIAYNDVTANVTANFVSGAANFSMTDLQGTWNFNLLWTDGSNDENTGWQFGTATVASNGTFTFSNCYGVNNGVANATTCPSETMVMTINSNGVVTQTSGGTLIGQMASDKALFVGTSTNNGGSNSDGAQMLIAQKVTASSYSTSDIESTNWVLHQLRTGVNNYWHYSNGTIDSGGNVTEIACTEAYGTCTPGGNVTLSVASTGIVTSSTGDFHGSLSSDKKTIIGIKTHNSGDEFDLLVFQITGKTYTPGFIPDGIYPAQVLSVYNHLYTSDTLPFWAYWLGYVIGGGGNMQVSGNVTDNNTGGNGGGDGFASAIWLPQPYAISSSGNVTASGAAEYNGQMSNDGTFIVNTVTGYTTIGLTSYPYYSLFFYLK